MQQLKSTWGTQRGRSIIAVILVGILAYAVAFITRDGWVNAAAFFLYVVVGGLHIVKYELPSILGKE